jgi:hypothetical protein
VDEVKFKKALLFSSFIRALRKSEVKYFTYQIAVCSEWIAACSLFQPIGKRRVWIHSDPGSGVFADSGSGSRIRNMFFPDLVSWIKPMTLAKNIWVKNSFSRCQSFTFTILRNLWLQERIVTSFIFPLLFFVDVESGFRDPGSRRKKFRIRNPGTTSRIRNTTKKNRDLKLCLHRTGCAPEK